MPNIPQVDFHPMPIYFNRAKSQQFLKGSRFINPITYSEKKIEIALPSTMFAMC